MAAMTSFSYSLRKYFLCLRHCYKFFFFFHQYCWFEISFLLLFWGYIVAFTNVLAIYHNWIHPFYHFPLFLLPHSWNSVSRFYFSICIHAYTAFVPYSLSYTISPPPPSPTGTDSHPRTYSALLLSDFVKEKNSIYVCVRELHREFPCDIPMHICVITWIASSTLFFSFLPKSPLYSDFNRFKNSILILI
jgi:hypothetical protein